MGQQKAVDKIIAARAEREPVWVDIPEDRGRFLMRRLSTSREFIALQRGEAADIMEMTAAAVVESEPAGIDALDLPPDVLIEVTSRWIDAGKAAAVPPPTA